MDNEKMLAQGWRSIICSMTELNINFVLCSGQSFRWKEVDGCWIGVYNKRVWRLYQDNTHIWYKVLSSDNNGNLSRVTDNTPSKRKKNGARTSAKKVKLQQTSITDTETKKDINPKNVVVVEQQEITAEPRDEEQMLKEYFQLNFVLGNLCKQWAKVDSHFSSISCDFPGVRMLRQDPVENLFSFICSSNNNITRISGMVEKMCLTFGKKIWESESEQYYSFPSVENLSEPKTEEILRGLGFGYRAKYIHHAAVQVKDRGGESWLHGLRRTSYEDAHRQLVSLPGVGAKVADCVCMMSLDKAEAVPVDTHVWQIAARDYKIPNLVNTKTLTPTAYRTIGDFFRNLWGSQASWAMNFLFVADLKQFQHFKRTTDPEMHPSVAKVKKKQR